MTRKQTAAFFAAGTLFTLVVGTLAHFIYEWTGNNQIAAIFFATNESTWEHLKLVFFPTLVYFGAAAFKLGKQPNFFAAWFVAAFVSALLIPLLFYSYTAILGKSVIAVDIAIFVISVIAGFTLAYFCYTSKNRPVLNVLSVIGLIALYACYFTFTAYPPDNFLFAPPA